MPKMGESIMEATILKWNKRPGDIVKQDETVLEIATDKVDSEVPSTAEGVLEEWLFQVNDVVPIGAVIARIRTGAAEAPVNRNGNGSSLTGYSQSVTNNTAQTANAGFQPAGSSQHGAYAPVAATSPATTTARPVNPAQARFYSPLVLNIASNEGIPPGELEKIPGTGNEGRVTKKDILQYVSDRKTIDYAPVSGAPAGPTGSTGSPLQTGNLSASSQPAVKPTTTQSPIQASPAYTYSGGGNVEILEMDRMRKLVAEHMVRSKHTSPHVTSFSEADVTNLVNWRNKIKNEFEKRENTRITFTPLFIEAIVHCIKKYPLINSSLDGDRIILKKDINIGMATALPSGNLIVPVIHNADQLNLVGLSKQVNTLAENARNSRLKPEDTQGGTFTMTNVGTFGSLMGTPIINQPQVAILAVGAIKKRPVVIETSEGDAIAIRHMMYLSLSYDHRIIDGSLGATFLSAVAKELENFDPEKAY
ncbi:MAG: dihydrolipoamide acetyltransferase family protein [Puia sp.]|nr:dihydrolipoamide acetyltransferase family protein [Puia sp.]